MQGFCALGESEAQSLEWIRDVDVNQAAVSHGWDRFRLRRAQRKISCTDALHRFKRKWASAGIELLAQLGPGTHVFVSLGRPTVVANLRDHMAFPSVTAVAFKFRVGAFGAWAVKCFWGLGV